jgi:hypothetical protein
MITGDALKGLDQTCLILTVLGGICLCFPWIFCLMNWWRIKVWPLYSVPLSTYEKL